MRPTSAVINAYTGNTTSLSRSTELRPLRAGFLGHGSKLTSEIKYVWVNFEFGMISIGSNSLWAFELEAPRIRCLRLEREMKKLNFHSGFEDMKLYSNLLEVHFICTDGLDAWYDFHCFPWKKENIWFTEKSTGRVMISKDLDKSINDPIEEQNEKEIQEMLDTLFD
ncbi:hypothetical protein HJFPF1_06356 [Paramyrothecium foliicola]|nr:hypothetical protein HJFPF1_06356 [Paramyrothecium foliicola]